jgi:hypothetical protein
MWLRQRVGKRRYGPLDFVANPQGCGSYHVPLGDGAAGGTRQRNLARASSSPWIEAQWQVLFLKIM